MSQNPSSIHTCARRALVCRLGVSLGPLIAALSVHAVIAGTSPLVVASSADAFVAHDSVTGAWTIGSAAITARLGVATKDQLTLLELTNPGTGQHWNLTPNLDTTVSLNGQVMSLATDSNGLRFSGAAADSRRGGVHLAFTYTHDALRAQVVRHYAAYPGSSTIETWTEVQVSPGADAVTVSNLTGWQVTLPVGTVRWINGLSGWTADLSASESFSLGHKDLVDGETVTLSAHWRSSERFEPFILIDGPAEEWYGGVQWSGAWQITCVRDGSSLKVTASYPEITTVVDATHPLEIPHSFFGVSPGGPTDVGAMLRPFVNTAIRQGRRLFPLMTYNTWYTNGTRVDEGTVMNAINQTAAFGAELFVLDAGWYQGAGANGYWDFETGLGTWTPDPERFPQGLRPLADFAHASGMRFGLWVEPARVSLDTVGQPGLAQDTWLATHDGRQVSATTGQICFGTRAGRQWVLEELTRLIEETQLDYLKWDDNAFLNCNRQGHDHGDEDGNLAHVQGLYAVLQTLRDRYPNLLIENVAGGGSRIDFGWLQYSDAAWMDDRTDPSARTRHHLQGLSTVFPPAYLLSFLIDSLDEPLVDAADQPAYLRSRMPGVFGWSFSSLSLRPSIGGPLSQAVEAYRGIRDILANADAALLSPQIGSGGDGDWDVIEEVDATSGNAIIFAFDSPTGGDRITIYPRRLQAQALYDVQSLDAGGMGTTYGDQLMASGIELTKRSASSGHVVILRVR
jgi:hypothetical protein